VAREKAGRQERSQRHRKEKEKSDLAYYGAERGMGVFQS